MAIALSGKERSGTTWLEHLIRENFINSGIDLRFKHLFTGTLRSKEMLTLVISKHPLDWWYSYYSYTARDGVAFKDFSTDRFRIWSDFYLEWLDWSEQANVRFIRYIDLYKDPEGTLLDAGLERFACEFNRITGIVSPNGIISDERFERPTRIAAYDDAPEVLRKLCSMVSEKATRMLGYDSLDP